MAGSGGDRHTALMQVFLVEDSAVIRKRLADLVASVPGAEICGEAASAEAAIREILATRPDVVVLDFALESGSGFDVLRAVHPQAPRIDFYLLSNFSAAPYRTLARTLGARDFFDKSDEFERVRDVIRERTLCMP